MTCQQCLLQRLGALSIVVQEPFPVCRPLLHKSSLLQCTCHPLPAMHRILRWPACFLTDSSTGDLGLAHVSHTHLLSPWHAMEPVPEARVWPCLLMHPYRHKAPMNVMSTVWNTGYVCPFAPPARHGGHAGGTCT